MEHSERLAARKGGYARSTLLRVDSVLLAYTSCAEVGTLSDDAAR